MPANKCRINALRLWKAITLSATLAVLQGCETMPKGMADLPFAGQMGAVAPSLSAPLAPPSQRTWPNVTNDVLNQRARGFGLVNAPEMQTYLNSLYTRMKNQAGVKGWPGSVYILASDSLQAYATGAGNIYISLPWLTSVQSEDELVALLSHEFGHIYLHFHQLEGAVADADTTNDWLTLGVAVAKKTAQQTGWTQVDTLTTGYMLVRGLVTTVYSRSQESAADHFGLDLTLKMGYSYEHGMKTFLERLAGWEEKNELREKKQQAQILQAAREQTISSVVQQSPKANNALSQSLVQTQGEVIAGFGGAVQQFFFEVGKVSEKIRGDHPPIGERIDAMALAIASAPDLQAEKEPVTRTLQAASKDKRTAAILANYSLAFGAIKTPNDPESLVKARQSASGVTATHAVPLFAVYTVMNARQLLAQKQGRDLSRFLELNFSSEADRAWKIYQERSNRLKNEGQTVAAKKVMDQGLGYFKNAEESWPEAIRFYGEIQGWDEAKRMAEVCGEKFRRVSSRCRQAAASPSEIAETERRNKAKSDQISKKLLKTP